MRYSIRDRKANSSVAWMVIQIASVFLALIVVGALVDHINTTRERGNTITGGALGMARTGYEVRDITGFSTDDNYSNYEGIMVTVKPLEGGEAMNLEKSIVYIQVGNRTARLHIVNGTTSRNRREGYYTE
jgi:archaellin